MAVEYIPATPDKVKVGDKVVIKPFYGNYYIANVTKSNKASFEVNSMIKFARNGATSDVWTPTRAYLYTPEIGNEVFMAERKFNIVTAIHKYNSWGELPLEKLEKIMCIISGKEE